MDRLSFLGLYRDPVVAHVTRRCDWRIDDLIGADQPTALYLVVPPSDISRTKPLIRLVLNQIGRRLTEELKDTRRRHRVLMMLDEFPALGRLDFFESALRAEQRRCQERGEAAASDPDCLAVWAETRDRFLGRDRTGGE